MDLAAVRRGVFYFIAERGELIRRKVGRGALAPDGQQHERQNRKRDRERGGDDPAGALAQRGADQRDGSRGDRAAERDDRKRESR